MKRILCILIALTWITFVSTTAKALIIERVGLISRISVPDSNPPFEIDASWLKIEGLNSAGICREHDGLVLLKIRDDERGKQQLAIAISAILANRSVQVNIDDDQRDSSNYCYLRIINIFR